MAAGMSCGVVAWWVRLPCRTQQISVRSLNAATCLRARRMSMESVHRRLRKGSALASFASEVASGRQQGVLQVPNSRVTCLGAKKNHRMISALQI